MNIDPNDPTISESAPFGIDDDGQPKAPYGFKEDGSVRRSAGGRPSTKTRPKRTYSMPPAKSGRTNTERVKAAAAKVVGHYDPRKTLRQLAGAIPGSLAAFGVKTNRPVWVADAATIALVIDDGIDATLELADTVPMVGKAVEYLTRYGPYATLGALALGVIGQGLVNHGIAPVGLIPGTRNPNAVIAEFTAKMQDEAAEVGGYDGADLVAAAQAAAGFATLHAVDDDDPEGPGQTTGAPSGIDAGDVDQADPQADPHVDQAADVAGAEPELPGQTSVFDQYGADDTTAAYAGV